jgi:hypothetical protein
MRKWFAVGTIMALVVAIPAIVWAFDPTGSSDINRQFFKFRTGTVTNSSTTFHTVPGLDSLADCMTGTVSATLSLQLSGAPVVLRIKDVSNAGTFFLEPGNIRVAPTGTTPFSFTWVDRVGINSFETFSVQWKTPSGGTTTAKAGDLLLQYPAGSGCPV